MNKILLILDLDETLIHARLQPLKIDYAFISDGCYVYTRPNLYWFLESISAHFDLAIWSSADDAYVENIVQHISRESYEFKFVWGRSKCTMTRNFELDQYVQEKRLKKVKSKGYSLDQVLIVDDSPEKTRENYGNAIYIPAFEGDLLDNVLIKLHDYLLGIKDHTNVRRIEKRGWNT